MPKRQRKKFVRFDPEFRFLLDINPALEGWRKWAAAWWSSLNKTNSNMESAIKQFFVDYLHGQGLHTLPPAEFFATGKGLPNLDESLGLANLSQNGAVTKHDTVSDFLHWVLTTQLSEPNTDGYRLVPAGLTNPFPRKQSKVSGKVSDLNFSYVLTLDPRLDAWRELTAEWLKLQKRSVGTRREALDRFLVVYLHGENQERNPVKFLLRETPKSSFVEVLLTSKASGFDVLSPRLVEINNDVSEFLLWVLTEKFGDPETGEWDRSRFHNPVERLSWTGLPTNTESNKAALSIRYIKELRGMLAQGRHFRDWTWAQGGMENGVYGGDWFVVDEAIIDHEDPDCVWRARDTTRYERDKKNYPACVFEMWSPVRAVALYIKLELPLRTIQVRMLDSGEADTWRYVMGPQGGQFVVNDSPLAEGSESHPFQQGVFHRSRNEVEAGIYINTNKTADSNKAENQKGYVIPWAHVEVLYWLEKLRNWQERYNPIQEPTRWVDLEAKHFGGTPPHPEVMEQRGKACFLFRDPTDGTGNKPLYEKSLSRFWYQLLARLEAQCLARGETLDDGTPIRFVVPGSDKATYFPPHALRVSLISYLILDLNLPVAVVSKLIAGHARIIMTLYYTKFGKAYMREVMSEAEKRELEADQANHRRFLMDATFEQIGERFAHISEDAVRAAIQNKSAAAFVLDDKGICPVGGTMCDVGGELIGSKSNNHYAPVPGYPQERNCVRCRFFLTGPAFLAGLQAHFNTQSEKMHRQSERHNNMEARMRALEERRFSCEQSGIPFMESKELERLSQRIEDETETMGKLLNDVQATNYLIGRSLEIASSTDQKGVKLVAVGGLSDLKACFIETQSELHQLEVVCENAVIYAETDASFAATRRSQILDGMLRYNGMEPVFMYLTPEQQLLAGNAVMQLIQARTGSIQGALEYGECRMKLKGLGLLEDVQNEVAQVTAGTIFKDLVEQARSSRTLAAPEED